MGEKGFSPFTWCLSTPDMLGVMVPQVGGGGCEIYIYSSSIRRGREYRGGHMGSRGVTGPMPPSGSASIGSCGSSGFWDRGVLLPLVLGSVMSREYMVMGG
jgi:hypothetical protein